MNLFLLGIDFLMPLLMIYWLVKKGSLSIVYVPVVYFAYSMLEKSKVIPIYHLLFAVLLVYYILFNLPFFRKNIFYVILILFFTYQLRLLDDWDFNRIKIIGLYWTLTIVALAPEICRNYSKERLFEESSVAGFWILGLFVVNSTLATLLRYFPENHYGFTSGVSFGHLDISDYNILPIAVFLVFRRGILNKKLLYLAVGFIALFLLLLTMRRMVMALALLGVIIALVELVNFKQIKQLVFYLIVFGLLGVVVAQGTGFTNQLLERFEKRDLGNRDLESEGRYLEFGLVYKDLFIYYDYNPWIGFGPLQSSGNYGKMVFDTRPLHSDITYFVHGFGFLGFFLYLGMVALVFYGAWIKSRTRGDFVLLGFVLLYFCSFLLMGSPKTPMSPVLLFMTLGVLYSKKKESSNALIENRKINDQSITQSDTEFYFVEEKLNTPKW